MPRPRRARTLSRALLACAALGPLASCDTLTARQRAQEAAALHKEGELAAAAAKFEEARGLDPSIATLHLNLGFTYLALLTASPKGKDADRNAERAVAAFEKYVSLKPDDPRGRQYLLQALLDGRRYDDAARILEPDLKKGPADPRGDEAIGLLAQIAAKSGRIDDALSWLQRRVDREPDRVEALEEIGVTVWSHLRAHPEVTGDARIGLADRGIAALQHAAQVKPQDENAYSYWNLLLRERAAGLRCDLPDAGAAAVPLDGGAGDSCVQRKAADLLEADRLMRIAAELYKAKAAHAAPQQQGPK